MDGKIAACHGAKDFFNVPDNVADPPGHLMHALGHGPELIPRLIINDYGQVAFYHLAHSMFNLLDRVQYVLGHGKGDNASNEERKRRNCDRCSKKHILQEHGTAVSLLVLCFHLVKSLGKRFGENFHFRVVFVYNQIQRLCFRLFRRLQDLFLNLLPQRLAVLQLAFKLPYQALVPFIMGIDPLEFRVNLCHIIVDQRHMPADILAIRGHRPHQQLFRRPLKLDPHLVHGGDGLILIGIKRVVTGFGLYKPDACPEHGHEKQHQNGAE